MALIPGIIGLVRDINERKENAKIEDARRNYMDNPDELYKSVYQIDPEKADALRKDQEERAFAIEDRRRKRVEGDFKQMATMFRGHATGDDVSKQIDEAAPFLSETYGIAPQSIGLFKKALLANPRMLDALTDPAYDSVIESRYNTDNVGAGAALVQDGKVIHNQPNKIESVVTGPGQYRTTFDPNSGKFGQPEAGAPMGPAVAGGLPNTAAPSRYMGGPLTVAALKPHLISQESSDDYTAVNDETGAMGRYQVMPKTGRTLAKRAGLAWRPDLMTIDTPESRRYQDAIGEAAMQDSIDAAGGDPEKTFSHYYSGSTTAYRNPKGNPKTARYTQEMLARLQGGEAAGGGGQQGGVRVGEGGVYVPPNPKAGGGTFRAATPDEIKAAGYPTGTAAQVGSDGKFVNLKLPSATAQKATKFQRDGALQALQSSNNLLAQVRKVRGMPGLATGTGSIQGNMPGWMLPQAAVDARNTLKALRNNVGLQQLMNFKAGSAQGASGFGNLSNAEGDKLEKIFGSLDDTSSDTLILQNLQEAEQVLSKVGERIQWQVERADAGLDWKVPAEGTVRNGHAFTGGSPANPRNWVPVKKGKR